MSQNTKVLTKKQFIEMLSEAIKDDQVVLYTQNVNQVELKPRFNEKRVTYGFAADAFKQNQGVYDLMDLNGFMLGVVVTNRATLSDGAKGVANLDEKNK